MRGLPRIDNVLKSLIINNNQWQRMQQPKQYLSNQRE